MVEIMLATLIGLTGVLTPWVVDAPKELVTAEWSLPLVGQEWRNEVTRQAGQASVFEAALEEFGTIGVLAHNWLEGERFTKLRGGERIGLVWADGRQMWYRVSEIQVWLKEEPGVETSLLRRKGRVLDSWAVYREVYGVQGRLVLQTCMGVDGGFYFVIATPDNGVNGYEADQRIIDEGARLPAAGAGSMVAARQDLGWLISISGEVVYE